MKSDDDEMIIGLIQGIRDISGRLAVMERWRRSERNLKIASYRVSSDAHSERLVAKTARLEQRQRELNLAILIFFVIVSFVVGTTLVFAFVLHKDRYFIYEFISYGCPALAALVAGLSVYLKKLEIEWFWSSLLLTGAGVIFFALAKRPESIVWSNGAAIYGLTCALFIVPYVRVRSRQLGKRLSRRGKAAWTVLGVVFVALSVFDLYGINRGSPADAGENQNEKTSMDCRETRRDPVANLIYLVCDTPKSAQ